ncbi:TetR/AcrR family transcriptional regulator [Arthrobacter ginkgonis]|uniref:TetR/AcrR family transcriptional regulator n=1 Tax=Arthrobacter ginkgonis TaxID=1630594 RepID=A0ABP7DBU1_9MICC
MTQVADRQSPERKRNKEETKNNILVVATEEFADKGFAGARIDEIAARTQTTKRMFYYYFSDKEGLYKAVVHRVIRQIRAEEQRVDVDDLAPLDALRRIAEITFDYHEAHPEFVRVMADVNTNYAALWPDGKQEELAGPIVGQLERVIERGVELGDINPATKAVDLHFIITSFSFFRISNQYTFDKLFGRRTIDPRDRERMRRILGDLVVSHAAAR